MKRANVKSLEIGRSMLV